MPFFAEAHAALAAVEWASGQPAKAEEQFSRALDVDTAWGDMGFVAANTRWPPALLAAMERFLSLEAGGAGLPPPAR